jgi:hypothetical protein
MDNTTIRCLAAKQLRERAKKGDPENGTALQNIHKIGLDSLIVSEIKTCIESGSYLDVSTGLYFLIGLLQKYKLHDFGDDFIHYLVDRLPVLLKNNIKGQAKYYALKLFIWLKDYYANYRETMLSFLNSHDLGDRTQALESYETYCKPKEIEPLLKFQQDDYIAELAMCGPLEYKLRNLALEKISNLTGQNFLLNKIKESHPKWGNDYVSWYDWEPFLKWWDKERKKFCKS